MWSSSSSSRSWILIIFIIVYVLLEYDNHFKMIIIIIVIIIIIMVMNHDYLYHSMFVGNLSVKKPSEQPMRRNCCLIGTSLSFREGWWGGAFRLLLLFFVVFCCCCCCFCCFCCCCCCGQGWQLRWWWGWQAKRCLPNRGQGWQKMVQHDFSALASTQMSNVRINTIDLRSN